MVVYRRIDDTVRLMPTTRAPISLVKMPSAASISSTFLRLVEVVRAN
jgi:hypothetical protein